MLGSPKLLLWPWSQDGVTVQQPVVTHSDGVTSGGNQAKVNQYGVILGNVGTGGSVDVRAWPL